MTRLVAFGSFPSSLRPVPFGARGKTRQGACHGSHSERPDTEPFPRNQKRRSRSDNAGNKCLARRPMFGGYAPKRLHTAGLKWKQTSLASTKAHISYEIDSNQALGNAGRRRPAGPTRRVELRLFCICSVAGPQQGNLISANRNRQIGTNRLTCLIFFSFLNSEIPC